MKATDKFEIIDKIARELQSRYTYRDINDFLAEYGVSPPNEEGVSWNSKWVYSKAALRSADASTVLHIAEELGIQTSSAGAVVTPPAPWQDRDLFRLFLSHISKHKRRALRLKECLALYGISAFVAHEDIRPTRAWQDEIERALRTMDAMVAIHSKGFSESNWTQQEVGYALGRGVKVISFKMEEVPTGFLARDQAVNWRERNAEAIAKEIVELLSSDARTAGRLSSVAASLKRREAADEIPF